jgi:ABC-2 type transport system ATP-binding protein
LTATQSQLEPGQRAASVAAGATNPGVADQPAIEIRGLTKIYGRVRALDRLEVSIPRTAVGLLGANGAGKTTLLRVLLGLSHPDAGSATVLGFDARREGSKLRAHVGYMPESDCLPPGATAADFVGHMAEMSGLPSRAARQRAADVLYQVGLDEERYRLIKGFSTGMKQRVKLAQAIVHDPGLVFLDEPTAGMDPQGREEMLDLILRIHRMFGISVIVSSHILEDIERVCDYIVILDSGRLVAAEPLAGIGVEQGDLLVRIDGDAQAFVARLAALGVQAEPSHSEEALAGDLMVRFDSDQVYDAVRDAAADTGVSLRSLRKRSRTLEDLYLGSVTGLPATQAGGSNGHA